MWQSEMKAKTELFAENYQELKRNFRFEYGSMHYLGALLYANEDRKVRVESITNAKDIIKRNTSFFSAFKDAAFFALAAMLSLEDTPEEIFKRTVNIYDDMKAAGFYSSPYLTLAAFSIGRNPSVDTNALVKRTREFYNAMKQEHRFLTSTDDYGFAAMLAASDSEVESTIREMEACYRLLQNYFGKGNALQSLTHILALGEETAEIKCKRVVDIYEALSSKGCKPSKYSQLSALGILVLISKDVETITEEIKAVYDMLLEKKGFGKWSITRHDRVMYSAALVSNVYIADIVKSSLNVSLLSAVTNIVIAQQTAMICATTSAVIASNSSSD